MANANDPRFDAPWRNFHQNIEAQVARLYSLANVGPDGNSPPDNVWRAGFAALQAVVAEAERQGKRVRAVGGGWSLSDIARTDDFMIDTRALNFFRAGGFGAVCESPVNAMGHRLAFAQCGVSIQEMNRLLESAGLCLKTSGASNGQTMAGAIATGTHGAAPGEGGMQDAVLGFHLIGERGNHIWLERASRPAFTASFCANVLQTDLVRDDAMFRAALVGVGGFGIVHAVLFECDELYLLQRFVVRRDVEQVIPSLSTLAIDSLDLPGGAEMPYHFEVVLNPYAAAPGQNGAYVRVMYQRPFEALPDAPPGSVVTHGPGDDLLSILGKLANVAVDLIPAAVGQIVNSEMMSEPGVMGTRGQMFGSSSPSGPILSIELGVPQERASDAARVLIDTAAGFPFAGALSFRYVAGGDALLGFTRFPRSCTIEVPCSAGSRTVEAFERICTDLSNAGIPYTLHWGQCQPVAFTQQHFQAVYGADAQNWAAQRRRFLPSPAGRRMFSNSVLDRYGLGD